MFVMFFEDNMSLAEQLDAILCSMKASADSSAEHRRTQIFSEETLRICRQKVRLAAKDIHERFGVTKVADITKPMLQWYLEKLRRNGRSSHAQYKACAAMCKAMQCSMGDFSTDRYPHGES